MQVRQTALQGWAAARLVLMLLQQGSQRGMQLAQQRVALRLQGPLQLQQRGHHGLRQVLLHHAAHQLPLGCVRHGACSDCLFVIVSSLPGRHLHSTACRIRETLICPLTCGNQLQTSPTPHSQCMALPRVCFEIIPSLPFNHLRLRGRKPGGTESSCSSYVSSAAWTQSMHVRWAAESTDLDVLGG